MFDQSLEGNDRRLWRGWGTVGGRRPPNNRTRLLFRTFDVSKVGLLPRVTAQENAEVSSTKPRGPYLYVRASAARACGVWHKILSRLFARGPVLQALARHRLLVYVKFL